MAGQIFYDISPLITPDLKVWPGDTPPSREVLLDMKKGDSLNLSPLHATVHLGAHVDAPSHYGIDAPSIECWPPERFVGPCEVVRISVDRACRVGPEALTEPVRAERILLVTNSTDLFASSDFETHGACLRYDMAILEGLVLKHVPPGAYELIALPLRLVGFDASPVRAVLREL